MVRAILGSTVFFFAAPCVVGGVLPWWISGWAAPRFWPGFVIVAAGAFVVLRAFVRFVREGRGTPAPVAPTEELVVGGDYRFVRNPMYVGVVTAILGQALLFLDWRVLGYGVIAWAVMAAFVKAYEEPVLQQRYGVQYTEYRRKVPAWIPVADTLNRMDKRFLGRTGLEVTELCLGTMTFGSETDEPTAHRILDEYVAAGGTMIDTADTYSAGSSEEIIGSWLKNRNRDDLVIATKVYGEAGPGQPVRGAGRKHILAGVEDSLRRLQTDFIDLYQIHVFDDATPLEETLSTLDALVTSGKVRFIGASNLTGWQLQKAIDLSRGHGWEPYVCLQPLYNLLDRDAELDLIPVCLAEGAGVIAWSPLAGGWLSGKYSKDAGGPPEGSRGNQADWDAHDNDRTWRVLDAVRAVADEVRRTPAQVALRWVVQRPGLTAPIIGARTPEQLADNLGATGWALTDDQMDRLTEAADRPLPYPHNILRLPQFVRRQG